MRVHPRLLVSLGCVCALAYEETMPCVRKRCTFWMWEIISPFIYEIE